MTALCEGSREPVVCDDLFGLRLASDDAVQRLLDDSRFQKGKVVSRLHQCRHLFDSMNATNAFGVSACYSSLSADMTRFASVYQKRAPLCTWMSQIDLLETDMLMDGMRKIRLEGSLYLLNGGSTTLLNYAHHSKYMPFILLPLLNNKRPDVCYSVQQRRALLRAAIWWFRNKTMDLDNLLLTKVAILKRFAEKPSDTVSLKVEACEYSSTCHGRTLGCTAICFGRQLLQCTNYCLCCVNVPVSGGHLPRGVTFTPNRRWPLVAGATVSETIICLMATTPVFPHESQQHLYLSKPCTPTSYFAHLPLKKKHLTHMSWENDALLGESHHEQRTTTWVAQGTYHCISPLYVHCRTWTIFVHLYVVPDKLSICISELGFEMTSLALLPLQAYYPALLWLIILASTFIIIGVVFVWEQLYIVNKMRALTDQVLSR